MFIDFMRNGDFYSAGTLLGSRVHLLIDDKDVKGQDKVCAEKMGTKGTR
jgi:hypothetical protein